MLFLAFLACAVILGALSFPVSLGVTELALRKPATHPALRRLHHALTWVPVAACSATASLLVRARFDLGEWPLGPARLDLERRSTFPPSPEGYDVHLTVLFSLHAAWVPAVFLWLGLEYGLETFARRQALWRAGLFWASSLAVALFATLDPMELASWVFLCR